MSSSVAPSRLHNYICERCFTDVPLTQLQYLQAMDNHGRFYCETCQEKRKQRAAELRRKREEQANGG